MRKEIFFALLLALNIPVATGSDLLAHQWAGLSIGRTNDTFTHNSGNNHGMGLAYSASISSSVIRQMYISFEFSRIEEFQAPMYDVYLPKEYIKQNSLSLGCYVIIKDIFIAPSIGHSRLKGINRGRWLGEPGRESYSCERLPYKSSGIYWKIEASSNANGWLGVGLQFSGTCKSSKDFFRASLLFKIGKQHKKGP